LQSEQRSGQPCFIWEHDPTIEHCKLRSGRDATMRPSMRRQSNPTESVHVSYLLLSEEQT
jgi:hypothetical protein